MRTTCFAILLAVSGMSGNLQAASTHKGHPHPHVSASATHRVKKGETAARIARDHGITVSELSALNPKVDFARLRPGTTLKLQGGKRAAAPAVPAGPAANPAAGAVPVDPLPATPAVTPGPLVHLERILPAEVQSTPPSGDAGPGPAAFSPSSTPSLAGMRRVMASQAQEPQDSQEDEAESPLPALAPLATASGEFVPADRDSLDLLWPVQTRTISSAWGPRIRTRVVRIKTSTHKQRILKRFMGSHKGVDLSSPMGKDIFAALDGQVVASGRQKGYGNYVALDHGNGVVTYYAHCNRNFVRVGEIVRRGQKIAEVGRTGNATGPHVHFELRLDGAAQNPLPFMNDSEEVSADMVAQNEAAVPPSSPR